MTRLQQLHRVPHTLAFSFNKEDYDMEIPYRLDLGDPCFENGRKLKGVYKLKALVRNDEGFKTYVKREGHWYVIGSKGEEQECRISELVTSQVVMAYYYKC